MIIRTYLINFLNVKIIFCMLKFIFKEPELPEKRIKPLLFYRECICFLSQIHIVLCNRDYAIVHGSLRTACVLNCTQCNNDRLIPMVCISTCIIVLDLPHVSRALCVLRCTCCIFYIGHFRVCQTLRRVYFYSICIRKSHTNYKICDSISYISD